MLRACTAQRDEPARMSPMAVKRPCSGRLPAGRRACPHPLPWPVHGKRPWESGRISSSQRGYGSTWRRLRAMILSRDPLCTSCLQADRVTPSVMVDHITPRSLGGEDTEANLQGLCRRCHEIKSSREGREAQR
jgi:5-methylcytosine-specific restriction protein A